MKILFINQFFWPDSAATSQQLTDMASGLAACGDEVSVLCGEGGYAAAAAAGPPPGVCILRTRALPFKRGRLGRILSYFSFYIAATIRALRAPRQDVIVSLTTPPLVSLIGTLVSSLRGSRHMIWEQDIYPDVATDLKVFRRGGVLDRVVGLFADFSRHHADGVIALGPCMRDRLLARGIPPGRVHIIENWASANAITPMARPRLEGEGEEGLALLYSGNLGLAHDLDTMTGAMLRLRDDPRFHFLFVGTAGKREDFAGFVREHSLASVEFRPYVSRDRLSEGLAAGDIGLVTQHNVCCGSVVPSKVYGILAAGRPVLFIGPGAATPALILQEHDCGWHIDPADVDGLTALLLHLADNPQLVQAAGARGRQALVEHYDLPLAVDRFSNLLHTLPGQLCTPERFASPRDYVSATPAGFTDAAHAQEDRPCTHS